MSLTIGMVLFGQGYPRDIRVEKEARSLVAAGHDVHLLTEVTENANKVIENVNDVSVHRVSVGATPLSRLAGTLLNRFPLRADLVRQWVREVQPDVVHVHDLVYAREVMAVVRPMGIPVVLDLHENMPAAKWVYGLKHRPIHRLFYRMYNSQSRWHKWEKQAADQANRVIVVVPEALDRFRERYAMGLEKFTIVSNTESAQAMADRLPQPLPTVSRASKAIYTGFYDPHRGMDTTIQAAGLVAKERSDFHLDIVGLRTDAEVSFVQNLVDSYGATAVVDLHKWVPDQQAWQMTMDSDIGLVPHNQCEHTETTIPHKLFHFMMAGKPVLVSDCRPLARVVAETNSGKIFRASDAADMARMWLELLTAGPEELARLSAAASRAAVEEFGWQHDGRALVEMYEGLESELAKSR